MPDLLTLNDVWDNVIGILLTRWDLFENFSDDYVVVRAILTLPKIYYFRNFATKSKLLTTHISPISVPKEFFLISIT